MKKTLKWLAVAALTPVLLFIILAALLYLPPVQNWVADKVAAIASEKTGMQISVGQVRLEWPLDLAIHDALCINDGDTIADIRKVVVDVQLRPLLSKRVIVDELSVEQAKVNTNGFVSDLRVKGHVGELWLSSRGIDLGSGTAEVNGARLADADLDIALSDTAAVDTTTSETLWRINADSVSIRRTAIALHLPGDTLHVKAYMGAAVAREADINLANSTYRVGSLDWHNGQLSYDDNSQTPVEGLDYSHIALSGIRLGVDSIYYGPLGTSLFIRETAMKEKSGLEITELTGGVRLDTAFNHIDMPQLTLRTPDSGIDAEVSADFNVADSLNPGKMRVRLNAQLGKQDLMRFAGGLPQSFIRQYPNHPLSIKGSVNGNMQDMEFTGIDVSLPTAFHITANGTAGNVTDTKRLKADLSLSAQAQDLNFLTAFFPDAGLRIPRGITLDGKARANGQAYAADFTMREGNGVVKGTVSTALSTDITAYNADISINSLNLHHFLPQDSLYAQTADLTAKATLKNGHAIATIEGHNELINGSINIDALLASNKIQATIGADLTQLDFFGLKLTDKPMTIGLCGHIDANTDMKLTHHVSGLISDLMLRDEKNTYHPNDIGLLINTRPDTTYVRAQSGDLIVKLDASGDYERLLTRLTALSDTVIAQTENRVIKQTSLKRLFPTMKLHVESKQGNPVANILKSNNIVFKELFVDLNTSPQTGINGKSHIYSLLYDSVRIDTIRLNLTQKGERMTYQGQVRNNRRNPQFVFNALIDGHLHEHGALAGLRYYDDKDRLGLRIGATAEMVNNGIRFQLMPDRPTLGYKEFKLNKDNYILLRNDHRIIANVGLIADDGTGFKIYSSEDLIASETENEAAEYLQDLTVSINRLNLGELMSVIPYLPRITGTLNGDYHIVQDMQEHISVVSDMGVQQMTFEGAPIGNISTELVYLMKEGDDENQLTDTHAIEARLMLDNVEFGLLQGTYASSTTSKQPGRINATFTMTRFPLSIANGFVTDQIIGLEGYGEGTLTIKGTTTQPLVDGEIYVDSAYLVSQPYGVRMRFDNDPVRIVGSHLLLENFGLYAYNDEPLNLQGDIDFSNTERIKMDMRMRASNLLLINTRQEAKSIAFGKAFINFFARMQGPLEELKMRGRLDVLGSTDLTYMLLDSPLSTDNRLEELVKFTDFNDTTQTIAVTRPTPSGLDMDLTVSVSQGAHVICNLNVEQTNYVDLMGGGDLRLRYNTEGLTLTGRYTLSNSEMKYSLPVIPLKTFTIQNGSYVEFTGDPMNPRLNITATERVKASVGQSGDQSRSVAFDCGVVITKTLQDMGLQFIITAPDDNSVNSELMSMSQEERGKIAVTMLTTGMYLADGNTSGFSMNSALSSFLQSEINNITGSALKTLDLSVGLDNTTDASGQMHTDYSFKFSKRLFDNRLKIQLGGKVSSGKSNDMGQKQTFFDNVSMEYRLNPNGTKNVKLFYQQNVYDWLDGYTDLYGAGFIWRKKMDSLLDVFKIFSHDTQQQPLMPIPKRDRPTPTPSQMEMRTDSLTTKEVRTP